MSSSCISFTKRAVCVSTSMLEKGEREREGTTDWNSVSFILEQVRPSRVRGHSRLPNFWRSMVVFKGWWGEGSSGKGRRRVQPCLDPPWPQPSNPETSEGEWHHSLIPATSQNTAVQGGWSVGARAHTHTLIKVPSVLCLFVHVTLRTTETTEAVGGTCFLMRSRFGLVSCWTILCFFCSCYFFLLLFI